MKRMLAMLTVFLFLFAGLLTRLAFLMTSGIGEVGAARSSRRVVVARSRGYIYDRNYIPLVNQKTVHRAAVLPCDEARRLLAGNLPAVEAQKLDGKKPCVVKTYYLRADAGCVKYFDEYFRNADSSACHVLGYVNAERKGVSGIEKSFDALLSDASGTVEAVFRTDAMGNALPTDDIDLVKTNYGSKGGVQLTLDDKIQRICEDAASANGLDRGAIVVLDAGTGEILACASFPAFAPANPGASLDAEGAPFLNRALTPYAVGSVFKTVTAAAALENGISPERKYVCTGSVTVGDTVFRCHKHEGHGELDMAGATAQSCNTYFITLAQELGGEKLLAQAKKFGFGEAILLAGGIGASAGTIPDFKTLSAPGELANFAFGQGALSASPLRLAAVYAAIADGGVYREPYLLLRQLNNNGDSVAEWQPEPSRRVVSEKTAGLLNEMLEKTVTEGSGRNARPAAFPAAGKTATAQSGEYADGKELLRTWFCGYF
ncbi:MAG: penicillin-binding protein 2, partial [Clostridia bacterium]|nr:penicillin-binding protein 2 [Clostridia bacterium]